MTASTRLAFLATVLVSPTGVATAEEVPSPPLGTLVRITTQASAVPVVGALAAVDEQSLTLAVADGIGPVVVARPSVLRLERRTRSQRKLGALAGGALGFGLGLGIVALGGSDYVNPWGFIYGAAGGVLVGTVSALASGPRWANVPLERIRAQEEARASGPRVQIIPLWGKDRRGAVLSVSLR